MLNLQQNEEITRVERGTPAGTLFRSYWLPVAHPVQLERRNPMPLEVLGENLALFRDGSGQLGLTVDRCAHRGTSLSSGSERLRTAGRIEKCGIRCPYHGWVYGPDGQCLEQPGEPRNSRFHEKVKIRAYPVQEKYGLIWAYLGEGPPPAVPPIDAAARTDGYRVNTLSVWPCNFYQICENMVDPVHVSILHAETGFDTAQFQAIPTIKAEPTDVGLRMITGRPGYERQSEFIFPSGIRIALPFMEPTIQMMFWTTPVNNTHTLSVHAWFLPFAEGVPESERQAKIACLNKFLYELDQSDPLHHSTKIMNQDKFACASQGAITDRSAERLGASDVGVITLRRLFRQAIRDAVEGRTPRGVMRAAPTEVLRFDNVC